MDALIFKEVNFFLVSIVYGMFLVFYYDLFRSLRIIIKHKNWVTGVEDLVFWLSTSVLIFYMLYRYNYGSIRGFAVLGMLLGMIVYSYGLSPLVLRLVTYTSTGIKKGCVFCFKYPIRFFCFVRKEVRKALKNIVKTVKIAVRGR